NAKEILTGLLKIYDEGLRLPIKLFPETSYTYVKQLIKKGQSEALKSARHKWETDNDFNDSESSDPYHRVCFNGIDPLDEAFMHLSEEVFRPLVEAIINE
ncbi:MAG TPA: hypothetical protein PK800_07565, partial [Syntrophorhabdaceae bacterium]|nr:hypothetical protein [Syntrophorhabdaceae bacterium]